MFSNSKHDPNLSDMECDNEPEVAAWSHTQSHCEEEKTADYELSSSDFDVNMFLSKEFFGETSPNTQSLHVDFVSDETSEQPQSLDRTVENQSFLMQLHEIIQEIIPPKRNRPILPSTSRGRDFDPLAMYRMCLQQPIPDEQILDEFLQNFDLIMRAHREEENEYQENNLHTDHDSEVRVPDLTNEIVTKSIFANQSTSIHSQQSNSTLPRLRAEADQYLIFKEEDYNIVSVHNFDYYCGFRVFKELKEYIEKHDPSLDVHFYHNRKEGNSTICILNRYITSQSPFEKLQKINLFGQFVSLVDSISTNQNLVEVEKSEAPKVAQNNAQNHSEGSSQSSERYDPKTNLFAPSKPSQQSQSIRAIHSFSKRGI